MIKLIYKPVSMPVSVLGGVLAGAIFKRLWKLAAGQDEAPKATEESRPPRKVRSSPWSRPRWTVAPPRARAS
jgi:Protein of unknown function (DUF4235)